MARFRFAIMLTFGLLGTVGLPLSVADDTGPPAELLDDDLWFAPPKAETTSPAAEPSATDSPLAEPAAPAKKAELPTVAQPVPAPVSPSAEPIMRSRADEPLLRSPEKGFFETQQAESTTATPERGQSGGWLRSLLSLAAVVVLIFLLAWGYRAIGGRGGYLPLPGRSQRSYLIDVVARKPLSGKQSLALVRVGPRLVLVGVGAESMRTLDVIDDGALAAKLLGEAAHEQTGPSRAAFADTLDEESRAFATVDEDTSQLVLGDNQDGHREPEPAWQQALHKLRHRLKHAS